MSSYLEVSEEFLNGFLGPMARSLEMVDGLSLKLEEGWFRLRAEGTKSVLGPLGVDYVMEASFEVELVDYDEDHQVIQFVQRGETDLRGREYLDDLMTRLASDPLPGLLLDLDFVRYRNRSYVVELERSGARSFLGGRMGGVPVTRLLPLTDVELHAGRLRFAFESFPADALEHDEEEQE